MSVAARETRRRVWVGVQMNRRRDVIMVKKRENVLGRGCALTGWRKKL